MSWDPWSALAERPHLELRVDRIAALLGGGLYARRGGRALIVLDPDLPGPHRRVALAHELVHDERSSEQHPRVPCASGLLDVIDLREERLVDGIVADRLVPPAELLRWIDAMAGLGAGVGPAEVAEWFEVPLDVAERALGNVAQSARLPQAPAE